MEVTPTATTCTTPTSASGSGGGGGGGGNNARRTPSTTPVATVSSVVIPSTVVPSVIPQGAKVSAVFSINLSSGSQSADVIRLQQLLSQDKAINPAGLVTGFYGSLTVEAGKKFQTKYFFLTH